MAEQFNAFIAGFEDLIPSELINVFDERELELLIGGIADIDVDDWKKHTDYRGYTEKDEVIINFWKVIYPLSHRLQGKHQSKLLISVFAAGMPNKSQGCCSSVRGHLVYLSMVSRICKEVMGLVDSPLRKPGRSISYLSHIHGVYSFTP